MAADSPYPASPRPPLYREEQRFRQWWVWAVVVTVAGLGWWTFVQQIVLGRPVGEDPLPDWGAWLVWLFMGLGLPLLLLCSRLVLEVTSDQVVISLAPFLKRVIDLAEIREARARVYKPIREYGGWGIKGWSRRNIAYNASGNRGVELTLRDGRRVMLGSQRADELERVIAGQQSSAPGLHAEQHAGEDRSLDE